MVSSGDRHIFERLRTGVLDGPGVTSPALRQGVAAMAGEMALVGAGRSLVVQQLAAPLAADLAGYVATIARQAYRVTDETIERLRAAGHSEETLFEITVAAAVGAGLARLERGLALLEEEK